MAAVRLRLSCKPRNSWKRDVPGADLALGSTKGAYRQRLTEFETAMAPSCLYQHGETSSSRQLVSGH
jgi:hypothetical protein